MLVELYNSVLDIDDSFYYKQGTIFNIINKSKNCQISLTTPNAVLIEGWFDNDEIKLWIPKSVILSEREKE